MNDLRRARKKPRIAHWPSRANGITTPTSQGAARLVLPHRPLWQYRSQGHRISRRKRARTDGRSSEVEPPQQSAMTRLDSTITSPKAVERPRLGSTPTRHMFMLSTCILTVLAVLKNRMFPRDGWVLQQNIHDPLLPA